MPFELQPTLKSEILELRPLRADDFEALYEVASDPLIWEQHPHSDRYKLDVFRKFFDEAMESGGAFIVLDRKDDRVIGSSRFYCYDLVRSEIEIGWTFLARSRWGGIYNGEMKRLMLSHAFRFVDNVLCLLAPLTCDRNEPSRRSAAYAPARRSNRRAARISFLGLHDLHTQVSKRESEGVDLSCILNSEESDKSAGANGAALRISEIGIGG